MLRPLLLAGGLSLALLTAQAQTPVLGTFRYPHYQPATAVEAWTMQVTDLSGGHQYFLWDITPGRVHMRTLNCHGNFDMEDATDMEDPNNDNVWLTLEWLQAYGPRRSTTADAHWGLQKTLDYWKYVHKRKSFDDQNTPVFNYTNFHRGNVDPATGQEVPQGHNAHWTTFNDPQRGYHGAIQYEQGNMGEVELTDLGTVAHEFGHGVNGATAKLLPFYEPGALNEGFSDIWAACVRKYAGMGPWEGPHDPRLLNSRGFPRYYGGTGGPSPDTDQGIKFWKLDDGFLSQTYGDLTGYSHTNGTVLLFWFYLLSDGGSGPNEKKEYYCVQGQGIDKAQFIALETEKRLKSNSQYNDAYIASLAATEALYGANSAELRAVQEAWYAVGVGPKRPTYTLLPLNWDCNAGTGSLTVLPSTPDLILPQITWTISPGGLLNSSNTTGPNQLSFWQVPGAAGRATITASIITNCDTPQVVGTQQFNVGNPAPDTIQGEYNTPPRRVKASIDPVPEAISYDWYVNGVLQSSHSITVTFNITQSCDDSYIVDVQANFGNCGASQMIQRTFAPNCSPKTPPVSGAYPNPASDYLTVDTSLPADAAHPAPRTTAAAPSTVTIYNSFGKPVYQLNTTAASQRLDVRQLPNGMYTLCISRKGGQAVRHQLVVQH